MIALVMVVLNERVHSRFYVTNNRRSDHALACALELPLPDLIAASAVSRADYREKVEGKKATGDHGSALMQNRGSRTSKIEFFAAF